jgi:hypothetical protein
MRRLRSFTLRISGLVVVASALALSVASSPGGGGGESQCGPLFEDGSDEGEQCEARDDCNEVCCLCDNGEAGFIAQGCDLDNGTCYGGDQVCQLALADDPTLCDAEETGDAGP